MDEEAWYKLNESMIYFESCKWIIEAVNIKSKKKRWMSFKERNTIMKEIKYVRIE